MNIQTITEISRQAPATPVPAGASGGGATAAATAPEATTVAPMAAAAPTPPPPPRGSALDLVVDFHDGTSTTVYSVVDPTSGQTVFQIPMEKVLDLVTELLHRLEAEG